MLFRQKRRAKAHRAGQGLDSKGLGGNSIELQLRKGRDFRGTRGDAIHDNSDVHFFSLVSHKNSFTDQEEEEGF